MGPCQDEVTNYQRVDIGRVAAIGLHAAWRQWPDRAPVERHGVRGGQHKGQRAASGLGQQPDGQRLACGPCTLSDLCAVVEEEHRRACSMCARHGVKAASTDGDGAGRDPVDAHQFAADACERADADLANVAPAGDGDLPRLRVVGNVGSQQRRRRESDNALLRRAGGKLSPGAVFLS